MIHRHRHHWQAAVTVVASGWCSDDERVPLDPIALGKQIAEILNGQRAAMDLESDDE